MTNKRPKIKREKKMFVDFGKEAIALASDLEEVQNVVDVSFGNMANQVE